MIRIKLLTVSFSLCRMGWMKCTPAACWEHHDIVRVQIYCIQKQFANSHSWITSLLSHQPRSSSSVNIFQQTIVTVQRRNISVLALGQSIHHSTQAVIWIHCQVYVFVYSIISKSYNNTMLDRIILYEDSTSNSCIITAQVWLHQSTHSVIVANYWLS